MKQELLTYAQIVNGCYEDTAVPFWEDEAKLSHVFIVELDGVPVFNFDGTLDWEEWVFRDFDAFPVSINKHPILGTLHAGFARGAREFLPVAIDYLTRNKVTVFDVIGHSKGAGEAGAFTGLIKDSGFTPRKVRLFEPPMVGSHMLRAFLAGMDIVATETVNSAGPDLVTQVPPIGFVQIVDPIKLVVPDGYDLATKHKMPAVLEALQNG